MEQQMKEPTAMVIFQPSGSRGHVPFGKSIIEASRVLGADIEAVCGEQGVCGKCRVRIEEGRFEKFNIVSSRDNVTPWSDHEDKYISEDEKGQGFRLGCMARIQGDLLVYVPEESQVGVQVVSKAAGILKIDLEPAVSQYDITVPAPSWEDTSGDFERLCAALKQTHDLDGLSIDLLCLRTLPGALRAGKGPVTVSVWMDKEIIRVCPAGRHPAYGIAIDVGTTTIAGYLCDLESGKILSTASMMNPQCKYGEDVMSRITYHMMNPDGLQRMSRDVIQGINHLIENALASVQPDETSETSRNDENRVDPADILDITLGCNTAMHHILLGLDPEHMGFAPFPPVIQDALELKARDVGITALPAARMFILPNEAGFVGADNVGVLLAEEPFDSDEIQLIIDIGTNGELVLGNRKKLIASSCATGPALEGAQLEFGMRAAPGAIERIAINPETHEVTYKVIGNDQWSGRSNDKDVKAKGICGSGILDLFAELFRNGIIGRSGVFNKKGQKSSRYRVNPNTNMPEFVVAWSDETSIGRDVVVTQKDVREIQLAKGALYAGCKLMMKKLGISSVDKVKIAGAFGVHVDREKALIMGLFPDCAPEKITAIGNAAGDGCRVALLDRKKRETAREVARKVEYIELTTEEDFQKEFSRAMHIPHMSDAFPHLEGLVPPHILSQ